MLGYQAIRKNKNGDEIDASEVYDGGCYFAMTVTEMINEMGETDYIEIKRVKK